MLEFFLFFSPQLATIDHEGILNPIQEGEEGGAKYAPPTSFSLVTSTNVGVSPPKLSDF